MDITGLLNRIRQINVDALKDAAVAYGPCILEPALCDDEGNVVGDGDLGLPCRVDLVPADDDEAEPITVDTETHFEFQALELDCEGVPVIMRPFSWDNALFLIQRNGVVDWAPLANWFWQWFDAESVNSEDEDGMLGVVHFLSDPEATDGGYSFVVDFGSAPPECFLDLIDALVDLQAEQIEVQLP